MNWWKWLFVLILALSSLLFTITLSPLLLIVFLVTLWYFSKKQSNSKWQKYTKYAAIINIVGMVAFIAMGCSSTSAQTHEANSAEVAESESLAQAAQAESESKRLAEEESKKLAETESKKLAEAESKKKALAEKNPNKTGTYLAYKEPAKIPSGKDVAIINNNIPYFSNEDITNTDAYHENGEFDSLGRVTAANAVVGVEIMPAEERGDISDIHPTGWSQARYAGIEAGGWLYNRSHLIGYQMTGNDSSKNLMTGTRWFNVRMEEYENYVANYIETTENHVRYRVTPVFEGNNLLASGAYMEGFSIEDNGESVMFNVYVPNVQSGVKINYADGSSVGPEGPAQDGDIVYHDAMGKKSDSTKSGSSSTGDISSIDKNHNGTVTIKEAKDAGFSMPIHKDHWLYPYMIDRDGDGMVGE